MASSSSRDPGVNLVSSAPRKEESVSHPRSDSSSDDDQIFVNDPDSGNEDAAEQNRTKPNTNTETEGIGVKEQQSEQDGDKGDTSCNSKVRDGFCDLQSVASPSGTDNEVDKEKEEQEPKSKDVSNPETNNYGRQENMVTKQDAVNGASGLGNRQQSQGNPSETDYSVPLEKQRALTDEDMDEADKPENELQSQQNAKKCKPVNKHNTGNHEILRDEKDDTSRNIREGNEQQCRNSKDDKGDATGPTQNQSGFDSKETSAFTENQKDGASGVDLERKINQSRKNIENINADKDNNNRESQQNLAPQRIPVLKCSNDEEDDRDLEKFAIILNGEDTIYTAQREEALKWRFIFDCPKTLKRLWEDPVLKIANLVCKSGKPPCIHTENPVRKFEELLKCHADTVQIHNAVIPKEGVELFLDSLNVLELFKTKLVVAYKVGITLYVCGTKEHMEKAIKQVSYTQKHVLNLISHTDTIALNDIPIKLMRKYINVYMLADTSKLRLELNDGKKVLTITGLENVVQEKAKFKQLLQSITTRKCEPVTCISHLSFFESSEVAQHIEEILNKQNLVCSWETDEKDCCIVVTAFDEETCEKAAKMIDTACVLGSITLKIDDSTWIIPSASWQKEACSICTKLGGKVKIWFEEGKDEVVYVHTHDIEDKVKDELKGLLVRWDREKHLSVEKQVFDQLTVKGQQKLRQLEIKYSVAIDVSKKIEKMGFMIIGKDSSIQSVLEELNSEVRIILKSNPKSSKQWLSSKDVEVALVPGSEDSDLVILRDKSLLHCNESNQAELRDMETNAEIIEIIPLFSLKINQPEDIEANLVLPADKSVRPLTFSCPHWNKGQSKDKHIFSSVLHHLFEFISSVGGEAVLEIRDTKIGSWDVRKFIKLMLFAYNDHVKTKPTTVISRLFLLIKDEEIWNIVKRVVHNTYSVNKDAKADDVSTGEDKSSSPQLVKESQTSRSRKAIQVYVVKDQMTKRKEDVLVNSAHQSLNLSLGKVSQSILEAAGENLQKECRKKYPNGIEPGQVAVTKAYKLQDNKFIFHGAFEIWKSQQSQNEILTNTLREFVTGCLQKADEYKMKTIAFPAIGTGKLNYPHKIVADCMFEAVEKYSQTWPTHIERVVFVIYFTDSATVNAFDDRMKRHKIIIKGSPVDLVPTSSSQGSHGAKPKTKTGPSPPLDQQMMPMKQEEQPVKDGTVSEGEDELTEAQCIENSEVTISQELMKRIPKGSLSELRKTYNVEIDYSTFSIKGQLEHFHRFEGYLRNLIGKCTKEDSLSASEDGMVEQKCSSIIKRKAVDNVSEVKYKMFRFFFSDLCVSFHQDVQVCFSGDEGCIYVKGESQEAVYEITDDISNAFNEMAKFQESDVSIKEDKLELAKQLVVEMNSCSPEGKVYCYFNGPFNIHIVARAMDKVQTAKHKINLKLGDIKITSRQKKLFGTFDDNNDNKQASSSSSRSSPPDNTRRSFMTAEGIKIFVYKCSILKAPVDVIVNAANEDLKHTGGVAKVIADAAGREFLKESQKYITDNNNLTVGASCITQGGNLSYAFVIHTVGPEWNKYRKTSEGLQTCMEDLWKAVIGCFFKAETLQVQSIGLPAVSSGIYGVPMEICASQYLSAVLRYSKSTQGKGSLKEIHFIDVNKEILDLIELVFSATLENNKAAAEEFNERMQRVLSKFGHLSAPQTLKSFLSLKEIDHSSENLEPHYVLQNHKSTFHFTKVFRVLIYTGDITDSTCQAIVSSEDKDLKSQGGVAKAIRTKAGQKFDRNLASNRGRLQQVGDVIEIDAGKLKCKKVVCCIIPKWTSSMSDEEYKRQMGQCFRGILEKARAYKSVAIPLIGTGVKNSNIEIYGRVLLESLMQFSSALRQKESLMEVHIVGLEDGPIVCVTSIFTEYFDSEKRLDSVRTKPVCKGVSSTTSSRGQGQPPQNSSLQSKKARQGSKSGEHNKARVEEDMDVTENLASYNNGSNQPPESQKISRGDDSQDNCAICLDTFDDPVKMKKCGHMFCKGCIDTQLQYKPVCPACGTTYGIITGNQPKGKMTDKVDQNTHLKGYEGYGMIEITYTMPNGVQGDEHPKPGQHYYGLLRKAYLPNNEKGQKVLNLLHLAFERRLIFTIGQSVTSGKDDMVTWNDIHHKTNMFGGPQKYGYPDPTYLDRVLEELAAKGVTEESERQGPETFSAYEKVPQESRV